MLREAKGKIGHTIVQGGARLAAERAKKLTAEADAYESGRKRPAAWQVGWGGDAEGWVRNRVAQLRREAQAANRIAESGRPGKLRLHFRPGNKGSSVDFRGTVTEDEFAALQRAQRKEPHRLGKADGRTYFWFRDRVWLTEERLSEVDVKALVMEGENRKRLQLERAHALMAMRERMDAPAKRQAIPQEVKLAVWQRDMGRCVECAAQEELEFDHIIPLAMGGSNTERNLQLLCSTCNRRKGAALG